MIAGVGRNCLALLLLISGPGPTDGTGEEGRLVVELKGLKSPRGSVALALFDDAESFDSRRDAVRSEFVPLRKKRLRWVVDGLAPGHYALVAYHDRNDNGELDRRAFGIPAEPYAFSNDARGRFGPPGFEAARFEIGPGSTRVKLRLK